MKAKKIKVAMAMSGGVDSSVAAKLLLNQGYEAVGFMMKLWSEDSDIPGKENACCDIRGVEDARRVAAKLKIPFYLIDAREIFKKSVVDYFINEYKNLRTPNPCVVCNERIKFGWLLNFAKKSGCDMLATGHHARIVSELPITNNQSSNSKIQNDLSFRPRETVGEILSKDPSASVGMTDGNIFHLFKGKDDQKDQSYFLYRLNQEQLSKVLFPIGEYTKPEVRAMAKRWNLPVHEKPESQEICFIRDKDYREFLLRHIPKEYFKSGEIIDKRGKVLGKHEGLINYTIGQRKGIEQIGKGSIDKEPLYVIGFDVENNQLIVGPDEEVYRDKMILKDIHFIQNTDKRIHLSAGEAGIRENLKVKIRYRHEAAACTIQDTDNPSTSLRAGRTRVTVNFSEAQRAITPGQSAVFYLPRAKSRGLGDEVLGGGIIQ